MEENKTGKKEAKAKGFFGRLMEKLDKKMEAKAKSMPCCCKDAGKGRDSCCS